MVLAGRHGLLWEQGVSAGVRRHPRPEAHQRPDQSSAAEGQAGVQGDTPTTAARGRRVRQVDNRQADADTARQRIQPRGKTQEDCRYQEKHSRCHNCKSRCLSYLTAIAVCCPNVKETKTKQLRLGVFMLCNCFQTVAVVAKIFFKAK